MTHPRQIMLEELRRRNFAKTTIGSYLHGVEHFSRYFHRPPDRLGPEHIRQYQAMLFTKLQFSATTVTLRLAALRFFYIRIEEKLEHRRDTLSKEGASSSGVLIQDEVVRLIDAAYDLGSHRLDGNILDRLALTSH